MIAYKNGRFINYSNGQSTVREQRLAEKEISYADEFRNPDGLTKE